jgi:hypothetical protein
MDREKRLTSSCFLRSFIFQVRENLTYNKFISFI